MSHTSFLLHDTATTEIYTLSLHDALPISSSSASPSPARWSTIPPCSWPTSRPATSTPRPAGRSCGCCARSEEHTSELQSLRHLVCRLLLEKKKTKTAINVSTKLTFTYRIR